MLQSVLVQKAQNGKCAKQQQFPPQNPGLRPQAAERCGAERKSRTHSEPKEGAAAERSEPRRREEATSQQNPGRQGGEEPRPPPERSYMQNRKKTLNERKKGKEEWETKTIREDRSLEDFVVVGGGGVAIVVEVWLRKSYSP